MQIKSIKYFFIEICLNPYDNMTANSSEDM